MEIFLDELNLANLYYLHYIWGNNCLKMGFWYLLFCSFLLGNVALSPNKQRDDAPVDSFYNPGIRTVSDLNKATRCHICNEKFDHCTKLLYHMMHLHKSNPVHFICKYLRSKPVNCDRCLVSCMSNVIYAMHKGNQNQLIENFADFCTAISRIFKLFPTLQRKTYCNFLPSN